MWKKKINQITLKSVQKLKIPRRNNFLKGEVFVSWEEMTENI